MANTPTAAPITPCPVDWCPSAGDHAWRSTPPPWGDAVGYRFHRAEDPIPLEDPHTALTVAAEVFEEQGTTPSSSVQLVVEHAHGEPVFLRDRETAEAVAFSILDAADLVFPEPPMEPCISQEDEAEFEAALLEVVERAEHPIDFNRLVSATIRLRRAYLGCAE